MPRSRKRNSPPDSLAAGGREPEVANLLNVQAKYGEVVSEELTLTCFTRLARLPTPAMAAPDG